MERPEAERNAGVLDGSLLGLGFGSRPEDEGEGRRRAIEEAMRE